jgi:arsenite/tail-anchored protein-transporting ATPase
MPGRRRIFHASDSAPRRRDFMPELTILTNRELKLLLFGGKGGVGKTTCASATALMMSRHNPGSRFLLVSTDPAHSLTDSFADALPPPNLKILELNAQESLSTFKQKHAWKLREIAARGTFLDEDDIGQFLDLSLPGLDELMAFLEITRLVDEQSYECIVVDTAPTGHTLRLLEMPELIKKWLGALDALLAKHRYMKMVFSNSCSHDELDSFLDEMLASISGMEALLQDPARCRFIPVMLADAMSVRETFTLVDELYRLNMTISDIVVNRIYPDNNCPACAGGRSGQMKEMADLLNTKNGSRFAFWGVPFYPAEIRGRWLDSLWDGVAPLSRITMPALKAGDPQVIGVESAPEIPSAEATLLIFAGKGGVGKTTLACATAVRLAQDYPGKEILLFSTDPAHSLSACLDMPVGAKPTRLFPGLTAMEIDARAEFQELKSQYSIELQQFLKSILKNMDLTFDRSVMEKILDLVPSGLNEVMALTRVIALLAHGKYDLIVLDSAPTGHLIRILELPELFDQWLKVFFGLLLKYRKVFRLPELSMRLVEMSKDLKKLKSLLVDPARAALYVVAIPAEMALEETKDLMAACKRMRIHVPALFLNLATRTAECSLCAALNQRESFVRRRFERTFPTLHHTLIYRDGELRGLSQLNRLGRDLYQTPLEAVAHGH